jgi:energy-coupling factor transporter ATP-binding protein EcfA2
VRALSKICGEILWDVLIEQLRVRTLQLFRQGSPLELINSEDEISGIKYVLYPLLPRNQFSLFYGEGGTGKSTLALFLALLIQTKDMPASQYGFNINGDSPSTVLYLDWDTDKNFINNQFKNLCKGFGTKAHLFYRRCNLPLAQDIENIKENITATNADVVIIDSVGVASGGDLNEAHTANLFSLALRSLKTTNFVISHTSKDRSDKKTPFGSVYFFNNARNIWEMKKIQSTGDDFIDIGLFHRKCNLAKLYNPFGFRFAFQNDSIIVENQKIAEIGEFEKELSLRQRIKKLLLQEGVLTIKEIAGQLSAGEQVVRSRLNELRIKGDVIKQGDKYAMHYE